MPRKTNPVRPVPRAPQPPVTVPIAWKGPGKDVYIDLPAVVPSGGPLRPDYICKRVCPLGSIYRHGFHIPVGRLIDRPSASAQAAARRGIAAMNGREGRRERPPDPADSGERRERPPEPAESGGRRDGPPEPAKRGGRRAVLPEPAKGGGNSAASPGAPARGNRPAPAAPAAATPQRVHKEGYHWPRLRGAR